VTQPLTEFFNVVISWSLPEDDYLFISALYEMINPMIEWAQMLKDTHADFRCAISRQRR